MRVLAGGTTRLAGAAKDWTINSSEKGFTIAQHLGFKKVYRVYGGDSKPLSFSWTPENPNTIANFRDVAGLPSGGASGANNTGRFVIEGTVDIGDIKGIKLADALDGNKGGLLEYKINPKNVRIDRVSGVNPEL
jgi:hypothetical protein